jgi:thiol-disulfide isomerase/thioredoxin
MIERIFIVALVAVAIALAWGLVRLWQRRAVVVMQADSPFVTVVPPGKPAIVAFSTPSCADCRTRQAPALKQLAAQFGEQVEIRSLQATEHPELVDRAGILTVPATVVLDARGVVRHLNLGFTDSETLASQLRSAA